LREWTSTEIAVALSKANPFATYSPATIEAHRDSYIESLLAWEDYE
jgi:hypothetical protein